MNDGQYLSQIHCIRLKENAFQLLLIFQVTHSENRLVIHHTIEQVYTMRIKAQLYSLNIGKGILINM